MIGAFTLAKTRSGAGRRVKVTRHEALCAQCLTWPASLSSVLLYGVEHRRRATTVKLGSWLRVAEYRHEIEDSDFILGKHLDAVRVEG